MAVLHITFRQAMDRFAPVPAAIPRAKQNVTTGVSSVQTSITAQRGEVCSITCQGGNAWVAFGANPTAAVGSDDFLLDGQTREFGHLEDGWKVAHING